MTRFTVFSLDLDIAVRPRHQFNLYPELEGYICAHPKRKKTATTAVKRLQYSV